MGAAWLGKMIHEKEGRWCSCSFEPLGGHYALVGDCDVAGDR